MPMYRQFSPGGKTCFYLVEIIEYNMHGKVEPLEVSGIFYLILEVHSV